MSSQPKAVADARNSPRVLLARNTLYQSGNSLSVSIPPDTLENTVFEVGDHAHIFSNETDREIAITGDTQQFYENGDISRGSRKIRSNSHGTLLISVPPKCLLDDLGYAEMADAKGENIAITIDPQTGDLFIEFPPAE